MNHPDFGMTESTVESDMIFLDAFDDIGSLDILSLNLSSDGQDPDGHKVLGSAFEIILTVIYACLAVTGLISNTALMGIILGKKMHRTPKNIFVLNLAISGISTAIICIPPTLIQCLYGGKWYLGLVACKLVPTIQGTNILVSSGTITAIAIDRWLSITKVSNGFPTKLTHTKVILINILIWTLAFLIASPVLVFQTIDTISLPWSSFSMCVEVWPAQWMKNTFTIIILCVQYLLPLIVLPLVHSQILKFLENNSGFALDAKRQARERKRNRRMTLVLSCIAATFVISSLPLNVFFTLTDFGFLSLSNQEDYFFSLGLCHALASSSCVSNPVLYGWLNTNLRKEFMRVLPASCGKCGDKKTQTSIMLNNNNIIITNDINSNITTSSRVTQLPSSCPHL